MFYQIIYGQQTVRVFHGIKLLKILDLIDRIPYFDIHYSLFDIRYSFFQSFLFDYENEDDEDEKQST